MRPRLHDVSASNHPAVCSRDARHPAPTAGGTSNRCLEEVKSGRCHDYDTDDRWFGAPAQPRLRRTRAHTTEERRGFRAERGGAEEAGGEAQPTRAITRTSCPGRQRRSACSSARASKSVHLLQRYTLFQRASPRPSTSDLSFLFYA